MAHPLHWLRKVWIDAWAALDFKAKVHGVGRPWTAPTWVADHARRLETYKVLAAYRHNKSREYLSEGSDRREYGDAALIIDVVRAAVTGDDISLAVDGADTDLPEDASSADKAKAAAAVARLDEIEQWADDERLQMKVVETERDAVGLGDGVYALGINREKGRTRLRCYDPGFYFPRIDPNSPEDEYPSAIDIAWEYEEQVGPETKTFVHRITWELGPIGTSNEPGDFVQSSGELPTRLYPWNDKPSSVTCYLTDAVWAIEDLDAPIGGQLSVESFPMDKARFVDSADGIPTDRIDLMLDFIPVVHVPNTVAVKEHYGQAILASVAQLLDDIQSADTSASKAAALAGTPILATTGPATDNQGNNITVEPGRIIGNMGQGGRMDVLDLSASLRAIMEYVEALRDRLSVNTRIPAEVLGRVKGADQPSALKVAFSFGTLRSMVEEMRLVRKEKYGLLLKFLQRMQIAAGFWSGEVHPANVTFGSFLPSDQTSTITAVLTLFSAHLISRRTAIARLVEEGIIQVDLAEELQACESEDFVAALAYFEATEDTEGTFELLHRTPPKPLPSPAPTQPVIRLTAPNGQPLPTNGQTTPVAPGAPTA